MNDMTTAATTRAPKVAAPRRFRNGAEFLHDLGDIPLKRIIFDPWPGTATEADLLRYCEGVNGEKRLCELVEGTLVEKPMGYLESLIAAALIEFLRSHVRKHKLGLVAGEQGMMRLTKGLVRLPDVSFVSYDRLPGRKVPRAPIPSLAPDLAVEILSKGNTAREMKRKVKEYFAAGCQQVWLINPRTRSAKIYEAPTQVTEIDADGMLRGGTVVSGFSLAMRKLFEGIDDE
jgi:Uma2 family endonuclease